MIDWHVTTYNDITITEGIGVVFQWNGPNLHSVVEMASQSSVDSCMYVGPKAALTGQVGGMLTHRTYQYNTFPTILGRQ